MLKVKPAQALKGVGLKKPASFLMYLPAGCLLVGLVVALSPTAGPRVPATLGSLTNHQFPGYQRALAQKAIGRVRGSGRQIRDARDDTNCTRRAALPAYRGI
jgi:hypothetical protein